MLVFLTGATVAAGWAPRVTSARIGLPAVVREIVSGR